MKIINSLISALLIIVAGSTALALKNPNNDEPCCFALHTDGLLGERIGENHQGQLFVDRPYHLGRFCLDRKTKTLRDHSGRTCYARAPDHKVTCGKMRDAYSPRIATFDIWKPHPSVFDSAAEPSLVYNPGDGVFHEDFSACHYPGTDHPPERLLFLKTNGCKPVQLKLWHVLGSCFAENGDDASSSAAKIEDLAPASTPTSTPTPSPPPQ
ncbi:hypothetical protein GGR52DRAFT_299982 [Hypoxylon sp. FL1284]|nr:hypothetical protein GGR52DRAFT_299982 [Hypoxylon sp. FL1284]